MYDRPGSDIRFALKKTPSHAEPHCASADPEIRHGCVGVVCADTPDAKQITVSTAIVVLNWEKFIKASLQRRALPRRIGVDRLIVEQAAKIDTANIAVIAGLVSFTRCLNVVIGYQSPLNRLRISIAP